ncbi:MAG: alkane 1-monooxygenase [Alphaproteobacteria bacterium]|nr:alkane 1-monooxygenase [Alphaproteobacteria bacterium]
MNLHHYLKFSLIHVVGAISLFAAILGGSYVTIGLVSVSAFFVIGDAILGNDTSDPKLAHPGVLTFQLWLALPMLALIMFTAAWSFSQGDPLGYGAFVQRLTGYDMVAAREALGWHRISSIVASGLLVGLIGTITAHELIHRTQDPVSMIIGRWLLAFSFDTSFAIEHVYGHHLYVATTADPATAPRGRSVYLHILISTIKGNVSAWRIEARRLKHEGRGWLTFRNAIIRGQLMSLSLVAMAWGIGGWAAAGFLVACGLWGKALLEIVNYIEHYGIVRDPALPVQPRHSWNTNSRISSWSMFNLTRHSHHHAHGEVPYHALKPVPEAPLMFSGYLATMLITLVPPLWQAIMTPRLKAWDRDHASPAERVLARAADLAARGQRPAMP